MKRRLLFLSLTLLAALVTFAAPRLSSGTYAPFNDVENINGSVESGVWLGTIVIKKDVVPGTDVQDFNFNFTPDGEAAQPFTLDDDANADGGTNLSEKTFLVVATDGPFTVTETTPLPTGWVLSNISCINNTTSTWKIDAADTDNVFETGETSVKITLVAGDTVTCTFENSRPGTIVIEKEVYDSAGTNSAVTDPQTFSFTDSIATGSCGGGGPDVGTLADDGPSGIIRSITCINVPLGPYTVTEGALPSGWTFGGIVCTDPSGGTTTGSQTANIALAAGETVSCIFKNNQPAAAGSITVEKVVDPLTVTGTNFSFVVKQGATTLDSFTLQNGQDDVVNGLAAATYTVTETIPTGWAISTIVCDADSYSANVNTGVATINLDTDEDVTCIYTNLPPDTFLLDSNGTLLTVPNTGVRSSNGGGNEEWISPLGSVNSVNNNQNWLVRLVSSDGDPLDGTTANVTFWWIGSGNSCGDPVANQILAQALGVTITPKDDLEGYTISVPAWSGPPDPDRIFDANDRLCLQIENLGAPGNDHKISMRTGTLSTNGVTGIMASFSGGVIRN